MYDIDYLKLCFFSDPTFSMVAVCVLESIGTLLLLLSLIAASLKLCYSTNQPAFFKVAGVLSIVAGRTFIGVSKIILLRFLNQVIF